MHLDGFKHEMDRGRSINSASENEEPELDTTGYVQCCETGTEKLLPKGKVHCFDLDELLEDLLRFTGRDVEQGLIQREIKQLVEDEHLGELGVVRWVRGCRCSRH